MDACTGWLIAVIQLVTAVACVRAGLVARIGRRRASGVRAHERRSGDRARAYRARVAFWFVLAGLLVLAAIDRSIGGLEGMTDAIRTRAADGGWYGQRRPIQVGVVIVLTAGAVGSLGVLLIRMRTLLPRHIAAFVGATIVLLLHAVRTISHHHVDAVLFTGPSSLGVGCEVVGLALILGTALTGSRWLRPSSRENRARS